MPDLTHEDLTHEELTELRARMAAFIDDEVIPAEKALAGRTPEARTTLAALQERAKKLDLWILGHPAELGGKGLPLYEFALINEIIGRSEYGQLAVGTYTMQDSIMLDLYASRAQRERWLKPLVNAEISPSVGLTEPEVAGSDPTRIATTAVLDGDEWVINGHKWFTTGASRAAFTTVFARTDEDAASPHGAVSAIIVPAGTPGLEISASWRRWATPRATTANCASPTYGSPPTISSASAARGSPSRSAASAPAASSTACAGSDRRSAPSS